MKKLLLIENDINVRDIIEIIFSGSRFEIISFDKIIPAEAIVNIKPDVIVCDYLLGNDEGSDLCLAVKANPHIKDIPFILYSGCCNLKQVAAQCCADAFIEKPFKAIDFLILVNDLALYPAVRV